MNNTVIQNSERMYSLLLKLYPKRYRQEFEEEMKYVFSQSLKDAYKKEGQQGISEVWGRTILDASKSIITQHRERQKGGERMKTKNTDIIMQNKVFLWIALATGFILMIPLIAMQISSEWNWSFSDFLIIGILIFGMGCLFVLVGRRIKNKYRLAVGVVFVLALLYIWAELAVGIFTNLGN